MVQFAAASQAPPALRAMAPVVTPADYRRGLAYRQGAFQLGQALAWHALKSGQELAYRVAAGADTAAEMRERHRPGAGHAVRRGRHALGVLGLSQNLFFELAATTPGHVGVSVLIPGLTRTRIFESIRNLPATVTKPPPSSFTRSSVAALAEAWDSVMPPEQVADVVAGAIREQRFYILPGREEALDMAEQQLRWMRANVPVQPGPGVARVADPPADDGQHA